MIVKADPKKRAATEKLICDHLDTIDPSGYNSKRQRKLFSRMDDAMFHQYMEDIRDRKLKLPNRKKRAIYLYTPNMIVNLDMRNILKAAHALGVKLFEKVWMYDEHTKRNFRTPHEYLIVTLPVRRLKQYLMDKISVPASDTTIDMFTGQVVKPDKGSSISGTEAQTYDHKGLHNSLTELFNVRGGNREAYAMWKSQLEETGEATLSTTDLGGNVRSAVVAESFLKGMHLDNNLTGGEVES